MPSRRIHRRRDLLASSLSRDFSFGASHASPPMDRQRSLPVLRPGHLYIRFDCAWEVIVPIRTTRDSHIFCPAQIFQFENFVAAYRLIPEMPSPQTNSLPCIVHPPPRERVSDGLHGGG